MNIYAKKQRWKIVLTIIAFLIVGISLWYTNNLVKSIGSEERQKAKIEQGWIDFDRLYKTEKDCPQR